MVLAIRKYCCLFLFTFLPFNFLPSQRATAVGFVSLCNTATETIKNAFFLVRVGKGELVVASWWWQVGSDFFTASVHLDVVRNVSSRCSIGTCCRQSLFRQTSYVLS